MQIGKVAAIRTGSPAALAGVQAVSLDEGPNGKGDRIAAVSFADATGKKTWFANGTRPPEASDKDEVRPLDPILLRLQLRRWAGEFPADKRTGLKVDLVVLRETEAEHKEQALRAWTERTLAKKTERLGQPVATPTTAEKQTGAA